MFTLKSVLGQKVWYFFGFLVSFFSGFIPYWIYQDTIVNTNFHWFEQVFCFLAFLVVFLGSFVVGFFKGGGMFFFKSVLFSQWQKIKNGFKKKGVHFPADSTCVDLLCNYLTYPFFLNVRQTGFLYLLICIYVIFKMLDSLYEKNMKQY